MDTDPVINITSVDQFISTIENNKYVFVDYYAPWCPPCKEAAPIIESRAKEFTEVIFIKVDIMQLEYLAAKYNVSSYPTFQLFKDGKSVNKFIGFGEDGENQIVDAICKLLDIE